MAADRQDARSTSRTLMYLVAALFLIVLVVILVRGCHESNTREEIINPDDPLPGAQTALPPAVPLLRAA